MTALMALIRKDLILFLGDRRALALTLAMPILLGAFFGYLFGGAGTSAAGRLEIGLVQLDDSAVGRRIAAALKADSALLIQDLGVDEARQKVLKGKLDATIVIPVGFGDAAGAALFGRRAKPEITIYHDPSKIATLQMVKGLLTQHVMQIVSAEMFGGKSGQRFVDANLADLDKTATDFPDRAELRELLRSVKKFQQRSSGREVPANSDTAAAVGGMSMPFTTIEEAMTSGPAKYNGYAHSFAGMAVQFILFMGIDVGIGVLLARKQGIWNRLLAAPITVGTVLLARGLSSALIAFALLCFIFAFAGLVFGVRITGSVLGFLGVGISFALVTSTFGMVIAAFGRTPEAARGLAVFATLIMVMLGGAWVPAFLFPQWLQTATLAVPTRWAVDGLDAMTWRGLGIEVAFQAMVVQLAFALLFGCLAVWKFRREAG
jgi:ABC-2 type transport system permease protein